MAITPLGKKVARGGAWVLMLRLARQGLSLIRVIVLARLLAPDDFGLFGLALLILSMFDTFSQTGFREALIQRKEDPAAFLNTAWSIEVIKGFAMAGLLFLVAHPVAYFFGAREAVPFLKAMALVAVFQGMTNIAVVYFEKDLKFSKYSAYQVTGMVVDLVVSVSAAFILRNAWALILGRIAGSAAQCAASYVIDPYRPRFSFDMRKMRELFSFGKWILGSSALVFFLLQGDDLFVGKMLGMTMLGFYQMAYRISNIPAVEISNLISKVTYPAYSKLQDDLAKLKDAYLRVFRFTLILSAPIAGIIFMLAPEFVKVFLGEKWMPMVPAMRVLAIYGFLRSVGATTGVMFMAAGKPEIRTKIQMGQLALLAVLIYPLTRAWGILGTSWAVTVYALVFNIIAVIKVLDMVGSGRSACFKAAAQPLTSATIMMSALYVLKEWMPGSGGIANVLALFLSGAAVYAGAAYLTDMLSGRKGMEIIRTQMAAFEPYDRGEGA